ADLVVRLVGSATQSYDLTVNFNHIYDDSMLELPTGAPIVDTYLRGDIHENGVVNIADAMMAAQYLAGNRALGELNAVNFACVRHDTGGDHMSISDAMFIAQYLAALRDAHYNIP
ncbi:MAG TPA: hypothetical protein G4O13_06600, partial [Dehalococcoidia bacterium]|nr:hypothetical protein [Dehalococcoidia bacterium]